MDVKLVHVTNKEMTEVDTRTNLYNAYTKQGNYNWFLLFSHGTTSDVEN
jgi:hypothetical protein